MTTLALLPDPSEPLEHETAEAAFADILDGKVPDEAIAQFLTAMTLRDETSVEIAAAARALRARMIQVDMRRNDMRHVLWIKACFLNRCKQGLYHAPWAWINDGQIISSCEQVGADNLMFAQEWQRNLPET